MKGRVIRTAVLASMLGACADQVPLERRGLSSGDGGDAGPEGVDASHVVPFDSCPRLVFPPRDAERCNVDPKLACDFMGGLTPCGVHGSIFKECVAGKWRTRSETYPPCGVWGPFGGTGGYPADGGWRDARLDASVADTGWHEAGADARGDAAGSGDGTVSPRD
jgi:hypothetical protein